MLPPATGEMVKQCYVSDEIRNISGAKDYVSTNSKGKEIKFSETTEIM
jgi:hypothetical protein